MGFLSSRRNRARVAPELDDQELGRLLKSLLATTRTGTIATTDLCAAQVSRLLDQDPGDWDRRTHRISVLADFLAASRLPRSWAAREPRNATALVLHAWSQVAQSRDQDRPGDTDDAVESCLRAAELAPDDPTPWVALLQVARRQRWKQPQVFGVWNEVLARDRWNREAYMNMLSYLTPEEGGSRLQVLEFVDALVARVPANAPCVATELTAQVFQYHAILGRGGYEALVARTHWSQGMAAQAPRPRGAHVGAAGIPPARQGPCRLEPPRLRADGRRPPRRGAGGVRGHRWRRHRVALAHGRRPPPSSNRRSAGPLSDCEGRAGVGAGRPSSSSGCPARTPARRKAGSQQTRHEVAENVSPSSGDRDDEPVRGGRPAPHSTSSLPSGRTSAPCSVTWARAGEAGSSSGLVLLRWV
ncbi:hypothetical protein LT493_43520 [Streptomyces tricolor]|nr:hypothetical protein [Streptomyces tricolor]